MRAEITDWKLKFHARLGALSHNTNSEVHRGPSQIDVVVMLIESSYYRQVTDSRTRRRVQSGKTLQKLAWGARLRPPKCRTTYSVRRAYRMWHGILSDVARHPNCT